MCGIIAYLGHRQALAILLSGLKRLEYRGYDSAGVGLVVRQEGGGSKLTVVKKQVRQGTSVSGSGVAPSASLVPVLSSSPGPPILPLLPMIPQGKVTNLEAAVAPLDIKSSLGIGHTRWATHGPPSDVNSHPHCDVLQSVAVVHNGIVENFVALRQALIAEEGCAFVSETDTEVFAHLIASVRRKNPDMPLDDVVRTALQPVEGAFGIAVVFADRPDLLIGARHGSPLLLGVGGPADGAPEQQQPREYFLASDASAVIEHTQTVEYLNEREMVTITPSGYTISSIDLRGAGEAGAGACGAGGTAGAPSPVVRLRDPLLHKLELSLEAIEKGGYKHFMLKEIMEQPRALRDAMRGRVSLEAGQIRLGGLEGEPLRRLAAARRLIIAGCGTSHHSALVGEYMIESLARLPVEVEYASEFRYRSPILFKDDVLLVLSQSGETADTLAAVREAKSQGVLTLGLVNVVGSTIARETDAGCYLHVGPEIGVASTKAFTGQVLLLAMLAVVIGRERGVLDPPAVARHAASIAAVPDLMAEVLRAQADEVLALARSYRFASSFLFLGRGFNFPVALEGALKLKEISYIHAEGYAAAEMKHGPIALIDKFMPVVVIAPSSDPVYDKLRSNIEEVLARGGSVVAVTERGNDELAGRCEAVLHVPRTEEWLAPLLTVVPLQLLSYHIADLRKCNVDQPRNLAKSVTVE